MRKLFEQGIISESIFASENESKGDVKVVLLESKCFDIRQFDKNLNYWVACFETSNTCDWDEVKRYVQSLLK